MSKTWNDLSLVAQHKSLFAPLLSLQLTHAHLHSRTKWQTPPTGNWTHLQHHTRHSNVLGVQPSSNRDTLLQHRYTLMVLHSPLLGWSTHGGFPKNEVGVILVFYELTCAPLPVLICAPLPVVSLHLISQETGKHHAKLYTQILYPTHHYLSLWN